MQRQAAIFLFAIAPLLQRVTGQDVRVDRQCYTFGQGDFRVSYSGADAEDDWVAFMPIASLDQSNINNNSLLIQDNDVADWAWRCGSTMQCAQTSGTVVVANNGILSPGEYVVVLAHNSDQQVYQGFAVSPVLTVAIDCAGPTPDTAPVAVPSSRAPPTVVPATSQGNDDAAQDLASARSMIAGMIANDADLAPKFLRLVFHDCLGGCDGCVDMNNPENFGLDKPIDALEGVFQQISGGGGGTVLSRADLWALSATVAVDLVQSRPDAIDFPFTFWGRKDCTTRDTCLGAEGQSVPCTPKFGPHHQHPRMHFDTADLYHFFASEFGFSAREAIVAMAGGHTIGSLSSAVRFPPESIARAVVNMHANRNSRFS
jgi:Peroxidase